MFVPTCCWAASSVEVLHWWTSPAEARSVDALKVMMKSQGIQWVDLPVQGGGGEAAMKLLQDRARGSRLPTAAQIKSPDLAPWGARGVLANLDKLALSGRWETRINKVVAERMKVNGHWSAIPINIHRVNWLWINAGRLRQVGGRVPYSWSEFFALAGKLQAAGVTPLAHGNQPWQDLTLFETVLLGSAQEQVYRSALVEWNPRTWKSPEMRQALEIFRRLKPYSTSTTEPWDHATRRVISGEAAMQIMGDWAKGEFLGANMLPDSDFNCVASPGSWRSYIYNIDSLAMFKQDNATATLAQNALALTLLTPAFQETFNLNKGSIPAVSDAKLDAFDHCASQSSAYFAAASLKGSLVPSFAHAMAQPEARVTALQARISRFWNEPDSDIEQAMAELSAIVASH